MVNKLFVFFFKFNYFHTVWLILLLELLQKLKTQGASKQSIPNANGEGQNARKCNVTIPGICSKKFIIVHWVIFILFKGSPNGEKVNQLTYTKVQIDTVKR